MTARVILSLDCEGKWGVADRLNPRLHKDLADTQLRSAYSSIIEMLDDFDIQATFAFVGLFANRGASTLAKIRDLQDFAIAAPDFLHTALVDLTDGSGEGWQGEWAVDAVASARVSHELALHGITHIPWDQLSQNEAAHEMSMLPTIESPVRHSRTFVFPRNRVAHTAVLKRAGIVGYRASPPERSRISSYLSEYNVLEKAQYDLDSDNSIAVIPGGFFVNWQSGLRRAVPRSISRMRVRNLLVDAARNGRVVHFWLHPENVATAPATKHQIQDILSLIAEYRDAGLCEVLTQEVYAANRGSHGEIPIELNHQTIK